MTDKIHLNIIRLNWKLVSYMQYLTQKTAPGWFLQLLWLHNGVWTVCLSKQTSCQSVKTSVLIWEFGQSQLHNIKIRRIQKFFIHCNGSFLSLRCSPFKYLSNFIFVYFLVLSFSLAPDCNYMSFTVPYSLIGSFDFWNSPKLPCRVQA